MLASCAVTLAHLGARLTSRPRRMGYRDDVAGPEAELAAHRRGVDGSEEYRAALRRAAEESKAARCRP
jgi:hypothetical protein